VSDEFRFSPRPNKARQIFWRQWGDGAFRESQETGKPILLSISAVWCHWCHMMDENAYSDRRVIQQINERFIPVRVDNDRRPDVNRRYNMGGWPTTVFLTETGDVISGGTYLPPENMIEVLKRIDEVYSHQRGEFVQKGTQQRAATLAQLRAAMKAEEAEKARVAAVTSEEAAPELAATADEAAPEQAEPAAVVAVPRSPLADTLETDREDAQWMGWLLDAIRDMAIKSFDPVDGGFGFQPKFPQPDVLAYLLLRATGCANAQIDEVVTRTLDKMADGDLYDRAEDGFFRYATKADWSDPHYEKMLEENAKLARLYLEAAVVYGSQRDEAPKAPGIEGAAFAAAQAQAAGAEAESREDEVAKAEGAPAEDGTDEVGAQADLAAAPVADNAEGGEQPALSEPPVGPEPDPERAAHYRDVAAGVVRYLDSVLWLPEANAYAGSQDADEEYYGLDLDARRERKAPFIDGTVFVDWNGLAVRTLLRASVVLDRPDLAQRAFTVLDGLWETSHGRRGMLHFAGQPDEYDTIDGLLGDQSSMAAALLDAYEVSGDRVYLARAEILSDWVEEHLTAPGGALFDRARGLQTAGLLAMPMVSMDEAAVMADVWMRLAAYTGESRYRARASRLFRAMRGLAEKMGVMASQLASAILRALEPQVHVVVTGPRDDPATRALHAAALKVPATLRTVQVLDPHTDAEHMVRDGFAPDGPPQAYVCVGSICLPPASDPGAIAGLARGSAEPPGGDE